MSIACKNKSTAVSDLGEEPEVANPTETLKPSGTSLNINDNIGPKQFNGKYFKSKEYKAPDGTKFRYTIEFKNKGDELNSTVIIYNGYEGANKVENREYSTSHMSGDTTKYKITALNYVLQDANRTATAYVYNVDGEGTWLDFKPNGYNFTVKLALSDKSSN